MSSYFFSLPMEKNFERFIFALLTRFNRSNDLYLIQIIIFF